MAIYLSYINNAYFYVRLQQIAKKNLNADYVGIYEKKQPVNVYSLAKAI